MSSTPLRTLAAAALVLVACSTVRAEGTGRHEEAARAFEKWAGGEDAARLSREVESSHPHSALDSLRRGLQWVDLANAKGDAAMSRKAVEWLRAIPDFRLARGYRVLRDSYIGVGLSLVGRDATNPVEKIRKVQEASALLDQVVKSDGDSCWYAVFLRGYVYSSLPDFFKKQGQAEKDLAAVLAARASGAAEIGPGVECRSEARLGDLIKGRGRVKEAIPHWKRAVGLAQGRCSEDSRKWLSTYQD